MASGKVHAVATSTSVIVVTSVVATVWLVAEYPDVVPLVTTHGGKVAAFVAGLVVGHYATPDVRDQHQVRAHTEHLVDKHFGKVAGKLWTALWWLPAYIIPHRSPFSHLPLFATTIAAAWLYGVPLALLWWYQPQWFAAAVALLPWHVAGWTVQDVIHLAQDGWRIRW